MFMTRIDDAEVMKAAEEEERQERQRWREVSSVEVKYR